MKIKHFSFERLKSYEKDEKINKSEKDLIETRAELKILLERIDGLDLNRFIYLKPGDRGYYPISFEIGILTVSLVDIKPYVNGSKVILRFGNPLSATICGLKAKLGWIISGRAQTKEVTFDKDLLPGAWTNMTVVLDEVPPKDFNFLEISDVHHTRIRLSRSYSFE